MNTHYLFGYGSLISAESRARTGTTGEVIPVRVQGYQREWNARYDCSAMTAVGVIAQQNAHTNGVLVEVEPSELPRFDEREAGYERYALGASQLTRLDGAELPTGSFWVYVPTSPSTPTETAPILQSYVDVILTGCLDFGDDFAVEFVRTTNLWDSPWSADRDEPRYVRAMSHVPHAKTIDRILREQGVRP